MHKKEKMALLNLRLPQVAEKNTPQPMDVAGEYLL
jgi:hypothetical protein